MIPAALLIVVVIAYRVFFGIAGAHDSAWLHNFSPLAAIALCGATFFPRRVAVLFPLGALLISDLIMNAWYRVPLVSADMLPKYLSLGLVCWLGWALRGSPRVRHVLFASLAGSVLFYVLTNTGVWFAEPAYAKTAAGWWQALTTGLPGFPPTIVFARNSLLSGLLFTLLFLGCLAMSRPRDPSVPASPRAEFARRLR